MPVVLYSLTSLDGAVDDPHRYFPETPDRPGAPVFDRELEDLEADMIGRQGAVLLGRTTWDQWSRYWPTSQEQPFADFINAVPKHVVTSRPLDGEWPGSRVAHGPVEEVVPRLAAETDGDLGVHASIDLARSLLRLGLVDELCLAVGRVVDPEGRRLFDGFPRRREMSLQRAVGTASGSVWLHYRFA